MLAKATASTVEPRPTEARGARAWSRTEAGSVSARRWLVFILLFGFVARIAILQSVSHVGLLIDDERDYHDLATHIVDGRGFASKALGTTSSRPPFYPAFVAAVWSVTGQHTLQAVRAAQIPLSLATVCLVWLIARRLFDERAAIVAAAIWSIYPSFLYAGALLLTEVLFTFFLLGAIWLGLWTIDRPTWWRASLAGVSLGLGALTRSVLWPIPVLLVPIAVLALSRRFGWTRALAVGGGVLAGFVVVVAPWSIRNTRLQQKFTVVDTMGGLNLRMGNFEYTLEDRMWDGVSLTGDKAWAHQMYVEHPDSRGWTEGQKEKWAQQKAIEYMRQHPATTLRRSVLKFADFWGIEREYVAALSKGAYRPPRWFVVASSACILLAYPCVLLLGWFGIVGTVDRNPLQHGLVLFAVLFICAVHSLVFGHSRYHLPVMPIVAIYAAAAVSRGSWSWLNGRRLALAGLGSLVFGAAWAHEIFFRDGERILRFLRLA